MVSRALIAVVVCLSRVAVNLIESIADDAAASDGYQDSEDGGDNTECVVCLSDMKDTIILPCKHLCLCSDCGECSCLTIVRCTVDKFSPMPTLSSGADYYLSIIIMNFLYAVKF